MRRRGETSVFLDDHIRLSKHLYFYRGVHTMTTHAKHLTPLVVLGYSLAAVAVVVVLSFSDNLQSMNKQVAEQGNQLLVQQRNLQDEIVAQANQRRAIEEREKEVARTMREHEKRLEDQQKTIEALEKQLAEQKKSYEEQRRRFEDLRSQLASAPR